MNVLKPPCVVVVRYILPAIRVLIARELVEKYGLKRIEVARKMGITPAAVTQYLEEVRGKTATSIVESSEKATGIISQIAEALVKNEVSVHDVMVEICEICRVMRSSGLICEMHKETFPVLKGRSDCEIPALLCPILNPQKIGK